MFWGKYAYLTKPQQTTNEAFRTIQVHDKDFKDRNMYVVSRAKPFSVQIAFHYVQIAFNCVQIYVLFRKNYA